MTNIRSKRSTIWNVNAGALNDVQVCRISSLLLSCTSIPLSSMLAREFCHCRRRRRHYSAFIDIVKLISFARKFAQKVFIQNNCFIVVNL